LVLLAAIVLVAATFTATAADATTRRQPIGNVTCDAGGGLSFSPPLTPTGSRGRHEKVTLTEVLTSCSGSPGTAVPSSPVLVRTRRIALPSTMVGAANVVGDCHSLASQLSQVVVKQTVKWGAPFQNEHFQLASRLMENAGIFYFFMHEQGTHTLDGGFGIGSAPSQSLQSCIDGSGGPIDSVTFDPVLSTVTEGTDVLTVGSVTGSNVAVADSITAGVVGGPSCASADAQATVQLNPAVPGTASLQLTNLDFSGCTIDMGPGVGTLPATVAVNNLPYPTSIGDGAGDPVSLGAVSLTMSVNGGTSTCTYASAGPLAGSFDNGTSSIAFGGPTLAFSGATGPLGASCPTAPIAAPSLTSLTDSTQSGSPLVFVA
jgi:hypothetical protein